MTEKNNSINGFCYLDDGNVVFVDLIKENKIKYSITEFKDYVKDNNIDEFCIFLAHRDEDGRVFPLYKYSLSTKKSKKPIVANQKSLDELIDVCYKICIRLYTDK